MGIQIDPDFLELGEGAVGVSGGVFFLLPEEQLGGQPMEQFIFQ